MKTKYNKSLSKFAKIYEKQLGNDFTFAARDALDDCDFSLDELKQIRQAIKMPGEIYSPTLMQVAQKITKLLLKEVERDLNDFITDREQQEIEDKLLIQFKQKVKQEVLTKFNKKDRRYLKNRYFYIE